MPSDLVTRVRDAAALLDEQALVADTDEVMACDEAAAILEQLPRYHDCEANGDKAGQVFVHGVDECWSYDDYGYVFEAVGCVCGGDGTWRPLEDDSPEGDIVHDGPLMATREAAEQAAAQHAEGAGDA